MSENEQEAPPIEATPANPGCFVRKTKNEDGSISVSVQTVGCEPTEVLTLLELGIESFRAKLGLYRQ